MIAKGKRSKRSTPGTPSAPGLVRREAMLQHRVTTAYRYERPPRREHQQPAGAEDRSARRLGVPLPGGFPMLSIHEIWRPPVAS
jgi:hypothetical protein